MCVEVRAGCVQPVPALHQGGLIWGPHAYPHRMILTAGRQSRRDLNLGSLPPTPGEGEPPKLPVNAIPKDFNLT